MRDVHEMTRAQFLVYTATWMLTSAATFYLVIPRGFIQKRCGVKMANTAVYLILMYVGPIFVASLGARVDAWNNADASIPENKLNLFVYLGLFLGLFLGYELAKLVNWAGQQQMDRRAECRTNAANKAAKLAGVVA